MADLELREVGPDDWGTWRALRLAALEEAPYAFGSTLADWQGPGDREDRWRARLGLAGAHNVVAVSDGQPVGMVSGVPAEDDPRDTELISMWVAPAARGTGVADVLVEEVERWAVAVGAGQLRLAVAEDNPVAARVYARHGFADTGRVDVMPDGRRRERVLEKRLGSRPDTVVGLAGVRRLTGTVVGLSVDDAHRFSKAHRERVTLVAGLGVEGDAHAGATVQHRSHVKRDPDRPNLRQVHLLQAEFFELARKHGHEVGPGDLGENVTTAGIDLLSLPRDTRVRIGPDAVVRLTGLRNPCWQIDDFSPGLLKVSLARDEHGDLVRRTGVMGVVEVAGELHLGDRVVAELPPEPHAPLDVV